MQEEIWKDVPNYEDFYQVSNLGNIKSKGRITNMLNGKKRKMKPALLKPWSLKYGYKCICLVDKNGVQTKRTIHSLVMDSFNGHMTREKGLVIDHIDGDPTNNCLDNLQVITHRQNTAKGYNNKKKYSTHVGISYDKDFKRNKRWTACIQLNGKSFNIGYFYTEQEAITAYRKVCTENGIDLL
jgi:hypothetical protein